MRFFRVILSLAVSLAACIGVAYVISLCAASLTLDAGVNLPNFAPSETAAEVIFVGYLLLAVVAITISVFKKELHGTLLIWGAVLALDILVAVAFFKLKLTLLSLAALIASLAGLIAITQNYFKYTRELFFVTIPLEAIATYLAVVNFAIVMMN